MASLLPELSNNSSATLSCLEELESLSNSSHQETQKGSCKSATLRNKQPMQWQSSSNTRSRSQKKWSDSNALFSSWNPTCIRVTPASVGRNMQGASGMEQEQQPCSCRLHCSLCLQHTVFVLCSTNLERTTGNKITESSCLKEHGARVIITRERDKTGIQVMDNQGKTEDKQAEQHKELNDKGGTRWYY